MGALVSLQRKRAAIRARLEQAIEEAIAALDALDGEADLEPSLGAPERPLAVWIPARSRRTDQRRWAQGANDDGEREAVSEDEGGACEDEGGQCEDEGMIDQDTLNVIPDVLDQTGWTGASPFM